MLDVSKVISLFAVSFGVFLVVIYCGSINYYPKGLTVADTIFFLAVALSFSFGYILITLGLLAAGVTLWPFIRLTLRCFEGLFRLFTKKRGFVIDFPNLSLEYLAMTPVGLIVIGLTMVYFFIDFEKALSLALASIALGFTFGLLNSDVASKSVDKRTKLILVLSLILTPALVLQAKYMGSVLDKAMSTIGVREEGVIVQLSQKYTDFLQEMNVDAYSIMKGKGTYKDVLIEFKGIGDTTVVSIQAKDGRAVKHLEVLSSDIIILQEIKPKN